MEKGVKEISELLNGLAILAVFGKKVAADKKVDLADLSHLVALAGKSKDVADAFLGLDQIKDELRNLSGEEAKQLLDLIILKAEEIKAA